MTYPWRMNLGDDMVGDVLSLGPGHPVRVAIDVVLPGIDSLLSMGQ